MFQSDVIELLSCLTAIGLAIEVGNRTIAQSQLVRASTILAFIQKRLDCMASTNYPPSAGAV
jgi:hypothetical protein